jgi:hypothetical protein
MKKRVHAGWAAVTMTLLAGSLFAMATASGSGTAPPAAKATDSSGQPMATMTQRRTPGVKRTLMNLEGTVEPGQIGGAVGTCPRTHPTPVSGWFTAVSNRVVLAESLPIGRRKWSTVVMNLDTVASEYVVGIVCLK